MVYAHSNTWLLQADNPVLDSADNDGSETLGPIDPSASILDQNSIDWADAMAAIDPDNKSEFVDKVAG